MNWLVRLQEYLLRVVDMEMRVLVELTQIDARFFGRVRHDSRISKSAPGSENTGSRWGPTDQVVLEWSLME